MMFESFSFFWVFSSTWGLWIRLVHDLYKSVEKHQQEMGFPFHQATLLDALNAFFFRPEDCRLNTPDRLGSDHAEHIWIVFYASFDAKKQI